MPWISPMSKVSILSVKSSFIHLYTLDCWITRLDHLGRLLSIHQVTRDLRDGGRENRERTERKRGDYLLLGSRSPSRWPWRWTTAWVAVAMDFPWLALALDRIGISVGRLATTNLVTCAPAPTSLYSATTGAHQPCFGWMPPIRAREGEEIESLDSVSLRSI
jgi:hypothetical protein